MPTPTVYGALSFTGDKIQTGAKALAAAGATAAPTFDEQEAAAGPAVLASYLARSMRTG